MRVPLPYVAILKGLSPSPNMILAFDKGHIVESAVEQAVYRAPYDKAVDVWPANCMYWCMCITELPMVRQCMCGLLTVCTGVCVLQSSLW